jgi:hypothetical protein
MASKVPKRREKGTAGTRKQAALVIAQKLEIIRRLEINKGRSVLWLHTTLDCQLSMI